MRSTIVSAILPAIITFAFAHAALCGIPGSGPDTTAKAAFRRVQALRGSWSRTTRSGTIVTLTYETISSGSAVVESFRTTTGRATMSVFHPDGDALLMTHYCAQGNQPRLRYCPGADTAAIRFEFLDATNLVDTMASHMVRNELRRLDSLHLRVIETYRTRGVDESDTLLYTRP